MVTRGRRTVGVEEELLLFAGGGARPAPAGELLRSDHAQVQHELMLEQAEVATSPVTSSDALSDLLRVDRAELVAAAQRRGVIVAALATSPLSVPPTTTPDERYTRMQRRFRGVVDDQLTCGTHVHVGVASRAEGVVALDGMRPWLSVLVALNANSPFWRGEDTGYASYRTVACGRWPTWGPTERFGDPAAYDARVAALIESGAALDPGMIYFEARLSARYPTVEVRVADVGQEAGDALLVAALTRAMVDTAVADPCPDLSVALLRAASWRAARFGLSDELYDVTERRLRPAADMVDLLVDTLGPALRANGDEDLVRREADRVLARGTGAELQRADLATSGSPAGVVIAAARRTAPG